MFKIDLHTHSYGSPDGGLRMRHYQRALDEGMLDFIAVTDHNRIDVAQELQAALGQQIIVGEEINTTAGEIIGLYLQENVPAGLSPEETVKRIKKQGGLVYVPHPFETVRKGVPEHVLKKLAKDVDILEVHNGRAVFQNHSSRASAWVKNNDCVGASSSDAHGFRGWGKTYSCIEGKPTRDNLVKLLSAASYAVHAPGVIGLLYPKLNRAKSRFDNAL
ncbi:MAG TPA: PHP domain-containing protein [Candidatus Saccharimonadales bacterium]|nr:PHP domain-containing protein [Candidatus Saccharimonadales bacterium]